jgi:hypothetical protein
LNVYKHPYTTAVSVKTTDFWDTMPLFAGFMVGLLFVLENGGSMILQNVIGLYWSM